MPSRKTGARARRGAQRARPAVRPRSTPGREVESVPLDAEDIALARLQADLRRVEDIREGGAPAAASPRRTAIRLPAQMLARLRERAAREHVSLSELIQAALARHLERA